MSLPDVPLDAVVLAVLVAAVVGVALWARRGYQERVPAMAEWMGEARSLSWRDRLRLERANSRGRLAPAHLRGAAVRRAVAVVAVAERQGFPSPGAARGLGIVSLLLASLWLYNALSSADAGLLEWANAVVFTVLGVQWLSWRRLRQRGIRNVNRSGELNAAEGA